MFCLQLQRSGTCSMNMRSACLHCVGTYSMAMQWVWLHGPCGRTAELHDSLEGAWSSTLAEFALIPCHIVTYVCAARTPCGVCSGLSAACRQCPTVSVAFRGKWVTFWVRPEIGMYLAGMIIAEPRHINARHNKRDPCRSEYG